MLTCTDEALLSHPHPAAGPGRLLAGRAPAPGCPRGRCPGPPHRHRVRVYEQDLLRLPQLRGLQRPKPLLPPAQGHAHGRGGEAGVSEVLVGYC